MITEKDLRDATWSFRMHGRMAKGGSVYTYQCDEHPELTIEKWRKDAKSSHVIRYFYNGTEVADLAEAADLLNKRANVIELPIVPVPDGGVMTGSVELEG